MSTKNLSSKVKFFFHKIEYYNLFTFRVFQFLRKYIFRRNFWNPLTSFSQLGEDLAIRKLVRGSDCEIFLDIGSFHPLKYSNTRLLKNNNWRGVHVDASKASYKLFKKIYPKDLSVNAIISNTNNLSFEHLKYNEIFPKNMVSAINDHKYNLNNHIQKNENTQNVEILSSIDLYNKCNKHFGLELDTIGFLNLDIEGLELDFLRGWPIKKCTFQFVCVENHVSNIEELIKTKLHIWLLSHGYQLEYFFKFSTIYQYNPS